MKDLIEKFFNEAGKEATAYLNVGCKFVATAGDRHYQIEVVDEGKVKVEEGKMEGDLEIAGEASVMEELFSSASVEEFAEKVNSYLVQGKKPTLKIFMERSIDNTKKFLRDYYITLAKLHIIR
ncbi:MAG: hypothetical protein QW222_03705 [Candidatus Bathyarchaeia archaeon]